MILKVSKEKALADLLELLEQGIDHRAGLLNAELNVNWDRRKSDYAKWSSACVEKLTELFEAADREPDLELFFGTVEELERLYEERISVLENVRAGLSQFVEGSG